MTPLTPKTHAKIFARGTIDIEVGEIQRLPSTTYFFRKTPNPRPETRSLPFLRAAAFCFGGGRWRLRGAMAEHFGFSEFGFGGNRIRG